MGYWQAIERVLLTLWVGGMWVLGFLVAPTLFAVLESRHVAGMAMGQLLSTMSHLGLVSGAILLLGLVVQSGPRVFQHWRTWVLTGMLLLLLVGEYGLAPQIIRLIGSVAGGIQVGSPEYSQFAILHGVASSLYLLNCLMGMVLVVRGLQRK
ncbi:MAG: DUF4149 domain-containing protein [Gammaproteobacteria bacterium]|nr:DUF4149 domain-containing protein [Gammaproteobacteria bacterium]